MSLAQTLVFSEDNNTFESFVSYTPEMMAHIGNLMVSFQNGQLYTHDNPLYNNFFGVQYPSTITTVFNKDVAIRKKYKGIGYQSTDVWTCPDIQTSTINGDTKLQQDSELISSDFVLEENVITAAFLRDKNSGIDPIEALNEGDYLGGVWIKSKFEFDGATLSTFELPYVTYILSNRNF